MKNVFSQKCSPTKNSKYNNDPNFISLIFIEIKKLDPFFLFLKNLLKGKKSDTCIFTESELFVVGSLV